MSLYFATAVALGGILIPYIKGGWIVLIVVSALGVAWRYRLTLVSSTLRLPDRLLFIAFNLAVIISVGGLVELAANALIEMRVVASYQAMLTVLPEGTGDWRRAHITADSLREPDPVLWWRPVKRSPYNFQGFKGPPIDPSDTGRFRVATYGDSNTDGPDSGGWPDVLQEQLRSHVQSADVINAGVAGYSSHQGFLRFEQEAPIVKPQIAIVSFGWNDVADTAGAPDSSFRPPNLANAHFQRFLLRYKSYRVLLNWLRPPPSPTADLRQRVSIAEYVGNLTRFRDVSLRHRINLVVMTRPHRDTVAGLQALAPNWRALVPAYNDALRKFARDDTRVLLIDTQQLFEGTPEDFVDECHFTMAGHRRLAEITSSALAARGWLQTN